MLAVDTFCARGRGGGGWLAYERGGDAGWKFWKTLKGDLSGRGPSFFLPLKGTMLKHRQMKNTATSNDGKDIIIEYFYL